VRLGRGAHEMVAQRCPFLGRQVARNKGEYVELLIVEMFNEHVTVDDQRSYERVSDLHS